MSFQQNYKVVPTKLRKVTPDCNDFSFLDGMNFIIRHLSEPLFPRTVFTFQRKYQTIVRSKQEMFNCFKDSNFMDCRISAFPSLKEGKDWKPDLIFIDLDLSDFKNKRLLDIALTRTLKKIKDKLEGCPTVLWTGGGYHIYQPIESITLTDYKDFNQFDEFNIFNEFLRFSKDFLSDNKADKNNYPSLKSCLLRIPNSVNSKYQNRVLIVQKWDGHRPHIKLLIGSFYVYLVQKLKNQQEKSLLLPLYKNNRYYSSFHNDYKFLWIEKLLETPIEDFRKNAINLIITPYLMHIKKISDDDISNVIERWLYKCNLKRKLDFNSKYFIKNSIMVATTKGIPPMKLSKLKEKNFCLYNKIVV